MSRVPVWTGLDPAPGAWDAWRIAIVGIQQLTTQPQLDYAGQSCVLVAATSYMVDDAESGVRTLGMSATTKCSHCGKAGHTVRECWTALVDSILNAAATRAIQCQNICTRYMSWERECLAFQQEPLAR